MSIFEAFERAKNSFLYKGMLRFPYSKVRVWAFRKLGHVCGDEVYIPSDIKIAQVFVRNQGKLFLGDRVSIGANVIFILNSGANASRIRSKTAEKPPIIKVGSDAWIGAGAIIMPGITIGDGAIVGAGAIVTKNVESNTVVAGNPARVIKTI